MGEARNVYKFWLESLKEKRPLGRPRRRWEKQLKLVLGK
jgi:hypothetical protein